MAELFLAKHVGMEGFEKVVAIKRILAHLAHDDEFVNMFRDEARLVAKLSHPNIVQIYDLGKSADSYFIAMEYIPGRNLASIAKKCRQKAEPFPALYIARAMAQACEALHYAHTRVDIDGRAMGIVHRDVSPQNIILSFSGAVKLVDFGIAKAATKIAHTRAGVLKGKYAYMSPEQIKGEEIDARSDLFSVGIVLFELLCGKRPFEKENSIQTLKAIVQDAHVDPRTVNPSVPDGMADIIHRALTKDRNQRFQTAQEVQLALEDFVASTGERVNAVVVGEWVSRLFDDELDRGKGGVVQLKGGGEVILPESEKMERSDREADAEDDADVPIDDEDAEADAEASAAREEAEQAAAPKGGSVRGGGSVMGRGASVPGERLRLLEEGVIGGGRRDSSQRPGGDEEATAIAGGEANPDPIEAAQSVGSTSDVSDDDIRPLYEEGVRGRAPAPVVQTYDDSHTELAGGSGPVLRSGHNRDSVPAPTVDLQAVRVPSDPPRPVVRSGPPQSSGAGLTPAAASGRPVATRAPLPAVTPSVTPPPGKATAVARPPAAAPASKASPTRTPAPAARPVSQSVPTPPDEPLDLGLEDRPLTPFGDDATLSPGEDDPWGDKTTAEPGSEDYTPDGGVIVRDASAWSDATDASGADRAPAPGKPLASVRAFDTGFRHDSRPDPWDDKTSANAGDPADEVDPGRVEVFDASGGWGDKTIGVDDMMEAEADVGFGGDVAIDATAGMSIEEIAAKLNSARGEKTSAMPALFEGGSFGLENDDRTEWGTSGREGASTDEWNVSRRAAPPVFDEDALPAEVDLDRNVELDSSTVAATSADYAEEGIEVGVASAFAYDEPTRGSTSEVEAAAPPPSKPKNALGAIRLAKVAAVPLGGVEELSSGGVEEPTSEFSASDEPDLRLRRAAPLRVESDEFGTEQIPSRPLAAPSARVVPQSSARLTPPVPPPVRLPAPPAKGASSPPKPPARGESRISPLDPPRLQPLGKSPLDVPSVSGEGTYNEPVLPPGGAILGDFDLDALLAPAPAALAPADPFAGIGSTRVPPASVSLSEMLLERSDGPGGSSTAKARPQPPRSVSGASLPPAPLKSAAMIRGASVAGSAPARPATSLRAIKETSRRPGGLSGVSLSPLHSSPPSAGISGLGTPVDDGAMQLGGQQMMGPGGYHPMGTPSAIPLQLSPPVRPRARMSTAQLVTIVVSCVVIAVVLGAIGYVKLRPPSLEIRTSPVGARVFLGGQILDGVTPLSVPIEPDREYTIRIVREGYEDHQGTVRIPRDKKAWMASFTLKPAGVVVPVPK